MKKVHMMVCVWMLAVLLGGSSLAGETPAVPAVAEKTGAASNGDPWISAMKNVHAKFKGTKGTFAQFGDSITISMAYWTGLMGGGKNMNPKMSEAHALVKGYMLNECWAKWKGPGYGNDGGKTIVWAAAGVDKWLQAHNPEVALIMFGSNDYGAVKLEIYEEKMREVVKKCLDNGTVVILSTPPPKSKRMELVPGYIEAVKKVAAELNVPVCDYYGEIMKRRPEDWDGSLPKFAERKGYQVLTIIAGDGVHPSNPKEYVNDYSEEALNINGFALRNNVVLMSYASVISNVLK